MKPARMVILALVLATGPARYAQADCTVNMDWPSFGNDPLRTSYTRQEVLPNPNYLPKWSDPSGAPIRAPAVVAHGMVFYARDNGQINNRIATSGNQMVGFPITLPNTDHILASPVWSNGWLYVVTQVTGFNYGGRIYCINQASGAIRWWQPCYYKTTTAPVIVGNKIMVFTDDWQVRIFDVDTGVDCGTLTTGCTYTPAAVWSGKAYYSANGAIYRYDPVANVVDTTITLPETYGNWACSISQAGDMYTTIGNHYLGAYNLITNQVEWTSDVTWGTGASAVPTLPAISDSVVVVASGTVWAVDRRTGATLWSAGGSLGGNFYRNSPIIAGYTVVATTDDGILYCFDLYTGAEIGHYPDTHTSDSFAGPIVADSLIFCGWDSGAFHALKGHWGAVAVGVPEAPGFALRGAVPNPGVGRLSVAFSLPDALPARLEVVDLAGRKVIARAVGGLGAGNHTVGLSGERALPAGMYFVRLIQGHRTLTCKVAIVR